MMAAEDAASRAADLAPYLGLAVAVMALIAMVNAWFGSRAGDGEYVMYVVLLIGGILTFLVLR